MDIFEKLSTAAKNGEIIYIRYHGGSHPGMVREVAPIKVVPTEMRARCYTTDSVKLFKLSKIEIIDDKEYSNTARDDFTIKPTYSGIDDIVLRHRANLEMLGWIIQADQTSITLHIKLKNGKLKKTPSVQLNHFEQQQKCWYVNGPGLAMARSFKDIDKAIALFLEQSQINHPTKAEN